MTLQEIRHLMERTVRELWGEERAAALAPMIAATAAGLARLEEQKLDEADDLDSLHGD